MPPMPQIVDHVDVDTAALESMVPVMARRFTELREGLSRDDVLALLPVLAGLPCSVSTQR